MPTVVETMSVRRTVMPTSPRVTRTKKVAMTIRPESGGTTLNIPYAPQDVKHTRLVADYVTTPRPGLIETVTYSNPMRPKMSMELKIFDKKVTATTGSVTANVRAISVIQAIQTMARKGTRVRIAYGTLESGLWYITDFSVDSERRDPLTDEITGATCTLEAIRGDSAISGTGTGPVTGGATSTSKPPLSTVPTASQPAGRYYVSKSGDNLISIAIKFYGSATNWRKIGDANKIKDARTIPAGTKLRIP